MESLNNLIPGNAATLLFLCRITGCYSTFLIILTTAASIWRFQALRDSEKIESCLMVMGGAYIGFTAMFLKTSVELIVAHDINADNRRQWTIWSVAQIIYAACMCFLYIYFAFAQETATLPVAESVIGLILFVILIALRLYFCYFLRQSQTSSYQQMPATPNPLPPQYGTNYESNLFNRQE